MPLRLVPRAQHVDELRPYHDQQRTLGTGIFVGGVAVIAAWAAGSPFLRPDPATLWVGLTVGAVVAVAGLLHASVGARMYEARQARRLVREQAARRP